MKWGEYYLQLGRLFEIVYILINKRLVTAKELSEHFEVSIRTIYRDIDILSQSGIPIYANKGKGGGIGLVDNYVLDKSLLSEKEQAEVLMSLQSLKAVKYPDIEKVIDKVSAVFNKTDINWIEVDFSHWGSGRAEKQKFTDVKRAIIDKRVISFSYYNSYGEKSERVVEPLKLLFKGQGCYLYGFCRNKQDLRVFKLTRIKSIVIANEIFERVSSEDVLSSISENNPKEVTLTLKIDKNMSYRVFDEFDEVCIDKTEDGNFIVTVTFPENEWVYGYLMSFGSSLEVIEPEHIKSILVKKLQKTIEKYL